MSIRAVKKALMDRLKEDTVLAPVVFEGVVTNRPNRYVTIFTDSGYRESERFTGGQWTSTQGFTVHSVGTTPDQAQYVAERVFAQLLDHVLVVPGRTCRRIRHASSQPVQQDTDISPPLYYTVDEFDVTHIPA